MGCHRRHDLHDGDDALLLLQLLLPRAQTLVRRNSEPRDVCIADTPLFLRTSQRIAFYPAAPWRQSRRGSERAAE